MQKYALPSGVVGAALAASTLLLAQPTLAQEFIKGGEDRFTLKLGGIVNQFDTRVGINGTAGTGTSVDLESNGLKKSLSSVEVEGTWRIADRHRADFLYFGAKRSGSRKYDRDITIGDDVYLAGFEVSAEQKNQFLFLDYRYSFSKSETLEFAGLLGLYGGQFNFDFSGTVSVDGATGATRSVSKSNSTTVPLPLVGVSLDWYVQPRWKVTTMLAGMRAKIGNLDGRATVFALGSDYMLTRNWGLGLSYMYTKVNADLTSSGFNGSIDWGSNAVLAYATMKF